MTGSLGVMEGAKRRTTLPSRATRNFFSKFQRMSGSSLAAIPKLPQALAERVRLALDREGSP